MVKTILEECWPKASPPVKDHFAIAQQAFRFAPGDKHGCFKVIEYNTAQSDSEFERCKFPSFYRGYLGRLINRRSLYLVMWEHSKNGSGAKSFPHFSEVFKQIRALADFSDRVLDACLKSAERDCRSSTWVPERLREWLIIEYKVGHGTDGARHWLLKHDAEMSGMDPTEYGTLTCTLIAAGRSDSDTQIGQPSIPIGKIGRYMTLSIPHD